jgi:hypothetical protein
MNSDRDIALNKAREQYQNYLRNYYHYKDIVEEYFLSQDSKYTKKEALNFEIKMNHAFDVLETLVFIFGDDVRK